MQPAEVFIYFAGSDDESSAVAVIDHLTTWIVTKKPSQCRSPKRICRRMLSNFFKQIEDEHEYESKICMSSVSESLEEMRSMEKAAIGGSTVSMSEERWTSFDVFGAIQKIGSKQNSINAN